MIKAVIFDLDNTLYDYDACNSYAMKALERFCMKIYAIESHEFAAFYDKAKRSVKERLGDAASSHNRMLYAQRFLELAEQKPAVGAMALYDTYWNALLEHMTLYAYVIPLFETLADRQIRIGLLTDLTAHIQHRKIEKLGIGTYIDALVTSEEAGKEKPDQVMFRLILEKLGVAADQAVMIGDSRWKDIEGALTAGMHGIWYGREKESTILAECMGVIEGEAKKE